MRILYKFPSRSRPYKFFQSLDNIQKYATTDNYLILVTADIDDPTMFNDQVNDRVKTYKNVEILYGSSTDKVNAINRDMALYNDWDILINMSDDMEFIKYGFDQIIIDDFKKSHSLDLLIHYPDDHAGAALITMAIMGKPYYDRFGFIYNPEYKSLFCDNEQQEVAKKLGRYKFIKNRLFNHNHPAWGASEADALMKHTESFWMEDEATFKRRKELNFI